MPLIGASVKNYEAMQLALQAAIELISKYAKELNSKDGGTRKTYASIQEFIEDASSK